MILPTLNIYDLNKDTGQRIVDRITEDIALNDELKYVPLGKFTIVGRGNKKYTRERLWGFDSKTATYVKLISYFSDARVTHTSDSLKSYVLKHCMVRFPTETARDKIKLITVIKTISILDFDMMFSEARNDSQFFSDSGFQDRIWLDPKNPINKGNTVFVKLKNERFEIRRK